MTNPVSLRLMLPVDKNRDHIRGPVDAPLTLVEYGDFECRHCGLAYPVVERMRQQMGDDLRFVFRQFPLLDMHPHAIASAQAAEAAAAQGRFWEMHDRLFEHQDELSVDALLRHAAAIGLDQRRFAMDLLSGVQLPRVEDDFVSGVRSAVQGTPTFFINGFKHEGARDAASLLTGLRLARGARTRSVAG